MYTATSRAQSISLETTKVLNLMRSFFTLKLEEFSFIQAALSRLWGAFMTYTSSRTKALLLPTVTYAGGNRSQSANQFLPNSSDRRRSRTDGKAKPVYHSRFRRRKTVRKYGENRVAVSATFPQAPSLCITIIPPYIVSHITPVTPGLLDLKYGLSTVKHLILLDKTG